MLTALFYDNGKLQVREGCIYPAEDMLKIGVHNYQGMSVFEAKARIEQRHASYKAQWFGPRCRIDSGKWVKVGTVADERGEVKFVLCVRRKQGFDC